MSHPEPCGLATPRWSVVIVVPQPLCPCGMAFRAGLPLSRDMVLVGPPLFARRLASLGFLLFLEVGWLKAQLASLEMLAVVDDLLTKAQVSAVPGRRAVGAVHKITSCHKV
jgi:hypothetical protein